MRFRSILWILILLTIASPAPGNPAADPAYWDILFELGYDPFAGRTNDALACRRIEMVYEFSRLVDNHAEADQALAATYRKLQTMLSSLDVGNLYDLLPYTDTDEARAVGIGGRTRMNSYRLSQYDPGREGPSYISINADGGAFSDLQRFGDMDFRAYVRPVDQDQYRFIADSHVFTADLSAVIIPRMVSGLMSVIWHHAGRGDGTTVPLANRYALNRRSLQVLGGFARELPVFFETVTHFFTIENVVSAGSMNQEDAQLLDLRVRINRNAFADKYPQMGAMLEILKAWCI